MVADPSADAMSYFLTGVVQEKAWSGQLDPRFQRSLGEHFDRFNAEDCDFYHTLRAPDGTVYHGAWDLSGRETE